LHCYDKKDTKERIERLWFLFLEFLMKRIAKKCFMIAGIFQGRHQKICKEHGYQVAMLKWFVEEIFFSNHCRTIGNNCNRMLFTPMG
jgi:hypothetical protein